MTLRYRSIFFLLLGLALLTLVGCQGRAFGAATAETVPVDEVEVVRSIQYLENREAGPVYEFSLTVPDAWVGQFETTTSGNSIAFEFINESLRRAPIFFVEALSTEQYWEQIGSYPGDYTNLAATNDTYFIYYLPIDAYYSGLSDEEYAAFAELVPEILQSFEYQRVN